MIEYLTLTAAEPMQYKSPHLSGSGAVKLRFDRPEGPVFGYIHKATEAQLTEWEGKVGQMIPVRIKLVSPRPCELYKTAYVVQSLCRDPRNDP